MTHDSRALHATPFVERRNERNGMERGSTVVSEAIYPFVFLHFSLSLDFLSLQRERGAIIILISILISRKEKKKKKERRKKKKKKR